MNRSLLAIPLLITLLTSCGQGPSTSVQQTAIADSIIQQIGEKQTQAALALTPTITPTPPPATFTATATFTPEPTVTPAWVPHPKGQYIYAPILLYHHILDGETQNRYNVSLAMFNAEMQALQAWGYTSITISTLANVIRSGGELPEKPVLITFDDGDIDIYQNAYPIMKKYGFVGTFYIVANRVGADQFVNADQLLELYNNGWEIGCHGYSHQDMSKDHNVIEAEGYKAKKYLQEKLGIPINTFAYPYGGWDATVASYTAGYGYTSGAGLGNSYIHDPSTLFYLSRMEVWGTADMNGFSKMLPWSSITTPVPLPTK
jgi:peptidoglycan/xylan/chitin deacetylase (PgdA/CDA1 family)